jgi:hypothetical protein
MLLIVKLYKNRILINSRTYSTEGCADLFRSHNLDFLQ